MTFPIHNICADLHHRTNMFEIDVKYWLNKLAELNQSGFAIGTLPMLQLKHDSKVLRDLADAIDVEWNKLIQTEELKHESV